MVPIIFSLLLAPGSARKAVLLECGNPDRFWETTGEAKWKKLLLVGIWQSSGP